MIHFLAPQLGFAITEEPSGISALGIDPLAILAQGLTFLVLYVVIKKYALTKILAVMQKRRETIEASLKVATELEQKQAELEASIAKLLKEARSEADDILHKARQESIERIKSAEITAKRRAEDILKENELRISHELTKAKNELKGEVADLVSDATGAVLRESLSPTHERKLIEMYLREVL
jgi:F-type H+-transporting ATPase subunit b